MRVSPTFNISRLNTARCGRKACGLWRVLLPVVLLARIGSVTVAAPVEERANEQTYRLARIPPDAKSGLDAWIWTDKTFDHQACRLWKDFDIPKDAKVVEARMRITVDDGYQIYLDGRELSQGANWRSITEYDLTLLTTPGRHVLAINAFNDFFAAGMLLDFRVTLADGRVVSIKSDESWKVVPEGVRNWEKLKRPQPEWQPATIIKPHPMWTDPRWPEDYIRVPPFQPLVILFWQTGWFQAALASTCGVILFVCIALIFQLTLKSKEQRLLNQERARIARDIHDDFGTRLTRLILEGELAQHELADARAGTRLTRINDGLREALGAMDEVLWAVNPQRDTVRDFVTYICEYAQAYLQPAGIQCLLEVEPAMPSLDLELPLRRSLLLAVKEAITNVTRHAGAQQLVLRISLKDNSLEVAVEDNGQGFVPDQCSGERHGLGNMVQRLNEVGGVCRIVSAPGAGCRVEFSVSLAGRRPRFGWLMRSLGRKQERGAAPAAAKMAGKPL
jgi:hypothetical protein